MKIYYKIVLLAAVLFLPFLAGPAFAQYTNYGSYSVQTSSATNISSNQATLNGYLSGNGNNNYYNTYVWFQYGTDTNYNNTTAQQSLNYAGAFSQVVPTINYNSTIHFRAVAQGSFGTVYGQDMTFYSSGSGSYYNYGNGTLNFSKQAINLTSGNLSWQNSISANPGDILSFAITMQPSGHDIHNVIVRESLPQNLIYLGNLTINTSSNYNGNISSGVNIGTIYANQPTVISYQARVADAINFSYGANVLANSATVTSNEMGTQTASASIIVTKSAVYGQSDEYIAPSTISTGQTNYFLTDSFFLPLLLIFFMSWLYFTGRIYKFSDWLKAKI
jgi:hypothetical protein